MAAAFRDQAAARGKTSELDRRAGIEHPPELLEQVGLRLLPPISTRRRIGKVVALEIERQVIERAALGESVGKLRVQDRKSVVKGTSVSVRVDLGGRRLIKTKHKRNDIIILRQTQTD